MYEQVLDVLSTGWRWIKKVTAAVVLGVAGGLAFFVTNDRFPALKEYYLPHCEEAKIVASDERKRVVLFREGGEDQRAVTRIRRALEERLPADSFRVIETCRTMQSLEKGKKPSSTADAVIPLLDDLKATLVLLVDRGGGDQVTIGFWPRGDKKDGQRSRSYDLGILTERERLAKDVVGTVFKNENEFGSITPDALDAVLFPLPTLASIHGNTGNDASKAYKDALRMLEWPLHEDMACEIKIKLAVFEFNTGLMRSSWERLKPHSVLNCPHPWKFTAYNYHGHSCLKMAMDEGEQTSVKVARFQCAETSYKLAVYQAEALNRDAGQYQLAAVGPVSGNQKRVSLLRSKYHLAYAQFELGRLISDRSKLEESRAGQGEVREEILELKMGAAPDDLVRLEVKNSELGSRFNMRTVIIIFGQGDQKGSQLGAAIQNALVPTIDDKRVANPPRAQAPFPATDRTPLSSKQGKPPRGKSARGDRPGR